jgi:hypothetical protein
VASEALPADVAPGVASIVAIVKETDALTLGTDLIFEVARDDGANWTKVEMTKLYEVGNISILSGAGTDISGQPSDIDMKWRVKSDNSKNFKLHAISLYWGVTSSISAASPCKGQSSEG